MARMSKKEARKRRQEIRTKHARRQKYWVPTTHEARRLRRELNALKRRKPKPKPKKIHKVIDKFPPRKEPDYAGNIANQYENSLASEASLTGMYFGGQY